METESNKRLTTAQVISPQDKDSSQWTKLLAARGEGYIGFQPSKESVPLATILHTSDWHICDVESPARQEYLDRLFDPDSSLAAVIGFIGTYRPHEAFTTQVAAAMIDSLNLIERGPIWDQPVDAVIITGDVTDNGQHNELTWYLDLLEGRKVDPSGGRAISEWVGAATGNERDERYWHPEGVTSGPIDIPTAKYGYPSISGLIEAARQPFKSPGLKHPWLSVHGNHDALLQGVVAPDAELLGLSIGSKRITGFAPGQNPLEAAYAVPGVGPAKYIHQDSAPYEPVTPDERRRFTRAGEFAQMHLESESLPLGHGFTRANVDNSTAYFSCEVGKIIVIALDSVNPYGGFEGSIDETQLAWLKLELNKFKDRYVIIASHHPASVFINSYAPTGTGRRVLVQEILDLLYDSPNVVAWLNGHEHEHRLIVNVGPNGRILPEINTASIIDWPQQARILEILKDPENKSISIISTVLDHSGNLEPDFQRLDLLDVAGISRELSYNDYQRREPFTSMRRKEGNLADRNVVIRVPDLLS